MGLFSRDQLKNVYKALTQDRVSTPIRHTKALFIHIPKSAGTSITQALYGCSVGHRKVSDYRFLGRLGSEITIFSVVRDPCDRFESAWNYLKSSKERSIYDKDFATNYLQDDDINAMVEKMTNDEQLCKAVFAFPHFMHQHQFINRTGRFNDLIIKVHEIYKFESMAFEKSKNDKIRQLSTNLSQFRASQKTSILNRRSMTILRELYDIDVRIFGYF